MTEKPAKARIRENQRRSRANKREYVASLEQKLAEYNARGIQASIEMQTAARVVALENQRLRMLLAEVGVSQERVETYLQSFDGRLEVQAKKPEVVVPPLCKKSPESKKSCISSCGGPKSQTRDSVLPAPSEPPASTTTCENKSSSCSKFRVDPTLETQCEAAASIILQMKGHGDESSLYAKFGCSEGSPATCSVKNTDLFRIMDEE